MSCSIRARAVCVMAAGIVALGYPIAARAQNACAPDAASTAFRGGDLDRLRSIYAASKDPKSRCAEQVTYCTGRLLAVAYRNKAAAADDAAQNGQVEALIAQAKSFGTPWQLLVAQGDLDFAHGRDDKAAYGRAASFYERALNELAEEPVCAAFGEPGPPPRAQIAQLHKRMQEAKLLAPGFDLVRTRDNRCGGVFLKNIRGFEPKDAQLPIYFEYNSTTFTPTGRKAAEALKECTAASTVSRIRLSGHTDKVGSDKFNMDLSARRLEAVKQFLTQDPNGYRGAVALQPMGKREPFVFADEGQISDADKDQANRRVILKDDEP